LNLQEIETRGYGDGDFELKKKELEDLIKETPKLVDQLNKICELKKE